VKSLDVKLFSSDPAIHAAACLACEHIAGLQYETAVSILTLTESVPHLQTANREALLRYVRDVFWCSPEWKEYLKMKDKQSEFHRAVSDACAAIPELDQTTAEVIIALIPDWDAMKSDYRTACVKNHWNKIKQEQKLRYERWQAACCKSQHGDAVYAARAAKESRRFFSKGFNASAEAAEAPAPPRTSGPNSGHGRGSGIGDPCQYRRTFRRSVGVFEKANWRAGWLRQWSTQTFDNNYSCAVAVVEDAATGDCCSVWLEDLKFDR
jgi:glutaredoxin-related protein